MNRSKSEMDIKLAVQNFISRSISPSPAKQKQVKSESSSDRDADGRREKEDKRRALTPEEEMQLIESLKQLSGVKKNSLSVEISQENSAKVLLIKTPEGKVVRRIPQSEFYHLFENQNQGTKKKTGQILNKAM